MDKVGSEEHGQNGAVTDAMVTANCMIIKNRSGGNGRLNGTVDEIGVEVVREAGARTDPEFI